MTASEPRSLLVRTLPVLLVLGLVGMGTWFLLGRSTDRASNPGDPRPDPANAATLLPRGTDAIVDLGDGDGDGDGPALGSPAAALFENLPRAETGPETAGVVVDYPLDGSVFPPEIVAPTLLWHDESEAANLWFVRCTFPSGAQELRALVRGGAPQPGPIDERAIGDTNAPYEPSTYQASAHAWTPPVAWWRAFKERSVEQTAVLTIRGVSTAAPETVLSEGRVTMSTSKDRVGAPIFYRDVPLMPAVAEESGEIKPLAQDAVPLIGWRLRDISLPESKLLLTGMPSCANCHSFSNDGRTMGMDVDGPQGDKGTYALADIAPRMEIEYDDVMTWNSFPDKPSDHKTIGFLSRVSPDGRYVASTVNESLYVSNFVNYRFLQVFFPTRGILAWYSRETGAMRSLPGADDPAYVHCSPVWTPDGETIVFARAEAMDPYAPGKPLAREPNDPNEPRIQYDLYRIPFTEGQGGTPEPIEGASRNGMSNTFPKVSPDGKWLVFTKCRNGLLMRPDGRLWIVPLAGGEAREMRCNTSLMNSWHSWSPNSRWLVFSSKVNTPYTQMFLTHVDEDGNDTPPILIPNSTASNRAVNIPEFVNTRYDGLNEIHVPAVKHHRYFWSGFDLLQQNRLDEGIELIEAALKLEPDWGRAHVGLGTALAMRGDPAAGIEHFETAIELNPDYGTAHHNLGYTLLLMGKLDRAVYHLQRAVALRPTMPKAEGSLADALARLGRFDDAILHYKTALEQDASDYEAHRGLARAWIGKGRPEKAIAALERVVELRPDDVSALANVAWQRATSPSAEVRDGDRAVELATRARDLTRGSDPAILDVLGAAYAEAGRFQEAVLAATEAARLAAESTPDDVAAIAARAALYRGGRPYRTSGR